MAKGLPLRDEWSSGGIIVDPAHTWFLYVLLVWSIVLLPVFLYLQSPRAAELVDRVAGFVARHGLVALGAFAVPIVLAESAFGANDNTGTWDRVPYLFFLLYGFLIALDGRFDAALRRGRRLALAGALPVSVVLIFWAGAIDESGGELMNGSQTGWSALQALAGWLWVVAILGYASAIVSRRTQRSSEGSPSRSRWSEVKRYANEAVLPFYVLHLPVIVGAAWVIVRWQAPILAKYLALVIVSFAGTLALYEFLVRRFRVMRFLFGMKRFPPELTRQGEGHTVPDDDRADRLRKASSAAVLVAHRRDDGHSGNRYVRSSPERHAHVIAVGPGAAWLREASRSDGHAHGSPPGGEDLDEPQDASRGRAPARGGEHVNPPNASGNGRIK